MQKPLPDQPQNCLITFVGSGDPYHEHPPEEEAEAGPILVLTTQRSFQRVILLATPDRVLHAERTARELENGNPPVQVDIVPFPVEDPSDFNGLISHLRQVVKPLMRQAVRTRFFIGTSSGTPQTHACWILLAAAGELPARVLQTRRARFVQENFPVVTELDLDQIVLGEARAALTDGPPPQILPPESAKPPRNTRNEAIQAGQGVGIIGEHPDLLEAVEVATTLAPYDTPILLQGETGTGKELVAELIHRQSGRPQELFVAVNCAAMPAQLAESILFGHRKGAFTGANRDHVGRFQQADGGTLFLDEIGELPLEVQAKLLRALEHGIIEPLGSYEGLQVNVRVIAATNRSLQEAFEQKAFRRDLFYRFGQVINLPPLRERRSDIPLLAMAFLDRLNRTFAEPRRLSAAALEKLRRAHWLGNVRDLQNVVERAALTCNSPVIEPENLVLREDPAGPALVSAPEPFEGFSMEKHLSAVRRLLIQRAIKLAGGNKSQAARLLGVTPQAVHKHLKQQREQDLFPER